MGQNLASYCNLMCLLCDCVNVTDRHTALGANKKVFVYFRRNINYKYMFQELYTTKHTHNQNAAHLHSFVTV